MNVAGVDPLIKLTYRWSDVSSVLLVSITGSTIARQRGYDIAGFSFIVFFSALGGGITRNVLISQGTIVVMSQLEYLILVFTDVLIARFVYFRGRTWEYARVHGDAAASGLWATADTVKGVVYGLPVLSCIMIGTFTAAGGSMTRDIVTGRVSAVPGGNQPTVIPAVACAVIVIGGHHQGFMAVSMVIGPIINTLLPLLGYQGN